ncbi:MAG: hypothetical protein AAFV53_18890 [Myxococcota bacterium]
MTMEIRPSLAETFDLRMHIDGFDATINHLPHAISGLRRFTDWLTVARIDLLVTALMLLGVGYVLLFLYVFTVLPELLVLTLLMGLVGVHATDAVIDGMGPAVRRLNEIAVRAVSQQSPIRMDASRLWIGRQNWRLAEVRRLTACGAVIRVELNDQAAVTFATNHIPWECARLCELVNAEIARHRGAPPTPPEALQRVIGRARGDRAWGNG